jgi:hypothetical protein
MRYGAVHFSDGGACDVETQDLIEYRRSREIVQRQIGLADYR